MKRVPNYTKSQKRTPLASLTVSLLWIAGLLVVILVLLILILLFRSEDASGNTVPEMESLSVQTTEPTSVIVQPTQQTEPTEPTAPVETEPTVPPVTEPQILENLKEMAEQNSDMIGWIKIEGTKLNYPLMYVPGDEEKYLHKNFEGKFSVGGLPFVDTDCSLDPRSDNIIIYGHNMKNGTMFKTLMYYGKESYWKKHPVILLSTLYEEKEYEIIAAFYDRVYYSYEKCFKFYQFIDAEDEAAFNEAIDYYKKNSLYDTGVTAEYGDNLITLVTCAYHVENGRFVVVAKEVTESNQSE